MSMLRFDGRVALITGAGRGLGREYALLLAARGAKVVVNDLGVDLTGQGKSSQPVDEVVATIRSNGGTAVPNYDSVEDGDKLVKTAIDNFGRVDILINNAGIIRDRTIARISDQDWDLVHRVHLRGSFMTTRAAWPYMKQQKYGRIIMTSSTSGLYGNFGQSNYSAAKLGLVGFANTLSKEGQKYNIACNSIAPTALSRLTENLMPPEVAKVFNAKYVAPVVAYLCHESCEDNGITIETGGGWAGKVRLQKSNGKVMLGDNNSFTVEDVRDNWAGICDMSNPLYHTNGSEASAHAVSAISEKLSPSASPSAVPSTLDSAIGHQYSCEPFSYTQRDIILYALGVGVNVSQEDSSDLKFLYEGHQEFSVLPSFAVIPAQSAMGNIISEGFAGLKVDLTRLLHGEQYVELMKPLPTSGTLSHNVTVRDILDKKRGAIVLIDVDSYDETGEQACSNQFSIYLGGAGGFGGKRSSPHTKATAEPPERPPDASLQYKTLTSQAALYRLSGDYNPLHLDPDFAAMGGFSTPILHGLCTFGVAARHVLKQYCNNDVTMFKAIKARFSRPVIPGQTIQTDMWKEGNRVIYRCKVTETGDVVLSGGYVDLNASAAPQPQEVGAGSSDGDGLKSTIMFEQMQQMMSSAGDEIVRKVKAVYLWNITKDGKKVSQWTVDLKNPPGSVYRGEPKGQKANCTMQLSDEDFAALAMGQLNPQQAFFQGKIKITGNIMLSQKLQQVFNQMAKL